VTVLLEKNEGQKPENRDETAKIFVETGK